MECGTHRVAARIPRSHTRTVTCREIRTGQRVRPQVFMHAYLTHTHALSPGREMQRQRDRLHVFTVCLCFIGISLSAPLHQTLKDLSGSSATMRRFVNKPFLRIWCVTMIKNRLFPLNPTCASPDIATIRHDFVCFVEAGFLRRRLLWLYPIG